ncbi:MAG: YtxH domain-containing protein [Nitrospirae bacterium]|uniref:YtxH domain-containing protein n=1 Tax=Candidatus Magnetobacterium casense TaxID=1455061 RepID=UPI0005906497|nr:YtxH domain-containing protein [Candidatus Magnetobacterium casensis]MBF0337891.1 YtxH domain-containing protein [Nitrospirota bacterium]
MVGEEEGIKKLKRYVMLGSFLGGLVGATVAVLVMPQSPEERRRTIADIQQDLYKPVKVKFNELVEHVGNSLIKAVDEAAKKVANGKMRPDDDSESEDEYSS